MTTQPRIGAVIVAAGSGVRFGDTGKSVVALGGRPLLTWSLALFDGLSEIESIVVVAGEHTRARCEELVSELDRTDAIVVLGGASRDESVRAGLASLDFAITHVAIHDAARPLASPSLVRRVIAAALDVGAAVPAIPVGDTLHVVGADALIAETPDRAMFRAAQTPQVARRDWLEDASRKGGGMTDDGGLLAAAGYPVRLVDGEPDNVKITWPADLMLAEAILTTRGGRA